MTRREEHELGAENMRWVFVEWLHSRGLHGLAEDARKLQVPEEWKPPAEAPTPALAMVRRGWRS